MPRVNTTPLHERLSILAGGRSFRNLGELTDTHPETVRRYMQGQAPSTEFLSALCKATGVSGEWLLTGRGPMKQSEARGHALREASAAELLSALSNSLEALIARVDRIELFVQMLEVRLRTGPAAPAPAWGERGHAHPPLAEIKLPPAAAGLDEDERADDREAREDQAPQGTHAPAGPGDRSIPQRLLRLRDALARRPRPDAH